MSIDRAELLAEVCELIAHGEGEQAKTRLRTSYPSGTRTLRSPWPLSRLVAVFLRDAFTDRYSGTRLVFPGTLRALSLLLGESFPYHPNWKQSATHPAFWELYPTIDHVIPVARGGADHESNVVTTSMLRNTAKANWLLEELAWPVPRGPSESGWDGLLGWFFSIWSQEGALHRDQAMQRWYKAARDAKAGST